MYWQLYGEDEFEAVGINIQQALQLNSTATKATTVEGCKGVREGERERATDTNRDTITAIDIAKEAATATLATEETAKITANDAATDTFVV